MPMYRLAMSESDGVPLWDSGIPVKSSLPLLDINRAGGDHLKSPEITIDQKITMTSLQCFKDLHK